MESGIAKAVGLEYNPVAGLLADEKPDKARVGLTDISARKYVRTFLGSELLSFAIPWEMFLEMESHVEGSFLERQTWLSLLESKL